MLRLLELLFVLARGLISRTRSEETFELKERLVSAWYFSVVTLLISHLHEVPFNL